MDLQLEGGHKDNIILAVDKAGELKNVGLLNKLLPSFTNLTRSCSDTKSMVLEEGIVN